MSDEKDDNAINWDKQPYEKQIVINWDKHGDLLGIINNRYGISLFIPRHILINNGIKVYYMREEYDTGKPSGRFGINIKCGNYHLVLDGILADHTSNFAKYISCSINNLLLNPIENSNRKNGNNDKEFGNIEL